MRNVGAVYLVLTLLLGSVLSSTRTLAQDTTPLDLLPQASDVSSAVFVTTQGFRSLDEQAASFSDPAEATRLLADWGWQENAFRFFESHLRTSEGNPGAAIEISITRFESEQGAAEALPYFVQDRTVSLGQHEAEPPRVIGDETRAVRGSIEGGVDFTLYVRSGPLVMRITAKSIAGSPPASPDRIAEDIIARAASQTSATISPQQDAPVDSPPLATLPPPDTTRSAAYSITDLHAGPDNWSAAYHINQEGQILFTEGITDDPGNRLDQRVRDQRAMLWHNGTVIDLTSLGISYSAVVKSGATVLPREIAAVPPPAGYEFVELAAINGHGLLVGTARLNRADDSIQRAILVNDGVVTVLDPAPGATTSRGTDINSVGQVVGNPAVRGVHVVQQPGRAFLFDSITGSTTDIGTLPGYQNSVATAINNVGQVVGYTWLPENWQPGNESAEFRRAYVYDHSTGAVADLNLLIPPESGWYLVDAFDINDAGQIVGRGLIGDEMHAFLLTPTR
jgi:Protein of unknown function (DUF3466)